MVRLLHKHGGLESLLTARLSPSAKRGNCSLLPLRDMARSCSSLRRTLRRKGEELRMGVELLYGMWTEAIWVELRSCRLGRGMRGS